MTTIIYRSRRAANATSKYTTYSEAPRDGFDPVTVSMDDYEQYANERFLKDGGGYKRGSDCEWFKQMEFFNTLK